MLEIVASRKFLVKVGIVFGILAAILNSYHILIKYYMSSKHRIFVIYI